MKFAISVPIGAWHDQLPLTFKSLFSQSVDVEIAVLDASNDPRVHALIDRYRNRFAYVRHGADHGQSDAIIEGWENLDGDWLGWLNADDALLPNSLEHIKLAHQEAPELEVIYGHSLIVDDQERFVGYHFNVEPPGPRLLEAGIISQPSCLFARSAYQRAGGLNRDLHYVMDWDLWIRLYRTDAKFGFVNHPLSRVVWSAKTKTSSLGKARRDELASIIGQHAPQPSQSTVFRDFMIDTLVDRLWPKPLKRRIQRKLRSVSQTVLGLRGDGYIEDKARLILPVYQPTESISVSLLFSHAPKDLNVTIGNSEIRVRRTGRMIHLDSLSPRKHAGVLEIEIERQSDKAPFFEHALLRTA